MTGLRKKPRDLFLFEHGIPEAEKPPTLEIRRLQNDCGLSQWPCQDENERGEYSKHDENGGVEGFAFDGPRTSFVVTMQKLVCGVMRARRSEWINGWTLPKLCGKVFGVCGFVSHWDLHGWSIFHKKSVDRWVGVACCWIICVNGLTSAVVQNVQISCLFSIEAKVVSFSMQFLVSCVARWLTVSEPTTPVSFWRVAVARVCAFLKAWRFVALRVGSFTLSKTQLTATICFKFDGCRGSNEVRLLLF